MEWGVVYAAFVNLGFHQRCVDSNHCHCTQHRTRVGQDHIYTVHIRYFWLGNHQIYGVYIRIYTVLANPV